MDHTFNVGDRVLITPEAHTRAGESGVITLVFEHNAIVRFDDGDAMAYLLDDGELEPMDAA